MMALRSVMSSRIPMVIILGATGTGKTKLSVELAKKFETEIISADSMQIYKGLDLVTAKASLQEREAAVHHLLDILEPHQMFTVVDFRNRALKIINTLTEQGKIPIIVGGTNYYIESIVYQILVEDSDDSESLLWDKSRRKRDFNEPDAMNEGSSKKSYLGNEDTLEVKSGKAVTKSEKESTADKEKEVIEREIDKTKLKEDVDNEKNFTNEEIHEKLKAIDPVMAARLHPNNRRKVLRSIEVWLKSGRLHSELLAEQKLSEGQLRRPGSTIILWLKCEQFQDDAADLGGMSQPTISLVCKQVALAIVAHRAQWIKMPRSNDEQNKVIAGFYALCGFRQVIGAIDCTHVRIPKVGGDVGQYYINRKGYSSINVQSVHDERLNARVDSMLEDGLIEELLDFHERHNKQRIKDGNPPDYTKGVFQTLGFKEFHNFLMLTEEERNSEEGKKLLAESIENMKMGTRRYARRQNKMIRGRFLEHPKREVPPIYELDTTNLSLWDIEVKNKAIQIIESYLNDSPCNYESLKSEINEEIKNNDGNSRNYCSVCDRLILGDRTFEIHLKSYKHMRVLKKKRKLEKTNTLSTAEESSKK